MSYTCDRRDHTELLTFFNTLLLRPCFGTNTSMVVTLVKLFSVYIKQYYFLKIFWKVQRLYACPRCC